MLSLLLSWSQGKSVALEESRLERKDKIPCKESDESITETRTTPKRKRKKNKKKKEHIESCATEQTQQDVDSENEDDDIVVDLGPSKPLEFDLDTTPSLSDPMTITASEVFSKLGGEFTLNDILECISDMWEKGQAYDNTIAVIERLKNPIKTSEPALEAHSKDPIKVVEEPEKSTSPLSHAEQEDLLMIARLEQVSAYPILVEALRALLYWVQLTNRDRDVSSTATLYLKSRSFDIILAALFNGRHFFETEVIGSNNSVVSVFRMLLTELLNKSAADTLISQLTDISKILLTCPSSTTLTVIERVSSSVRRMQKATMSVQSISTANNSTVLSNSAVKFDEIDEAMSQREKLITDINPFASKASNTLSGVSHQQNPISPDEYNNLSATLNAIFSPTPVSEVIKTDSLQSEKAQKHQEELLIVKKQLEHLLHKKTELESQLESLKKEIDVVNDRLVASTKAHKIALSSAPIPFSHVKETNISTTLLVSTIRDLETALYYRLGSNSNIAQKGFNANGSGVDISLLKSYFESQKRCVELICSRIHSERMKLLQCEEEANVYAAMGMRHVVQESTATSFALQQEIQHKLDTLHRFQLETVELINNPTNRRNIAETILPDLDEFAKLIVDNSIPLAGPLQALVSVTTKPAPAGDLLTGIPKAIIHSSSLVASTVSSAAPTNTSPSKRNDGRNKPQNKSPVKASVPDKANKTAKSSQEDILVNGIVRLNFGNSRPTAGAPASLSLVNGKKK